MKKGNSGAYFSFVMILLFAGMSITSGNTFGAALCICLLMQLLEQISADDLIQCQRDYIAMLERKP